MPSITMRHCGIRWWILNKKDGKDCKEREERIIPQCGGEI